MSYCLTLFFANYFESNKKNKNKIKKTNNTLCNFFTFLIDDDTKPVEMVDKELDLYSEVNDANVADYVLNIANDYPVQYETSTFQKVPNGI